MYLRCILVTKFENVLHFNLIFKIHHLPLLIKAKIKKIHLLCGIMIIMIIIIIIIIIIREDQCIDCNHDATEHQFLFCSIPGTFGSTRFQ